MIPPAIPEAKAKRILEVLDTEGLAPTDDYLRLLFTEYVGLVHLPNPLQYRLLGFHGVKFEADSWGRRWLVACYREELPRFGERIKRVNERLEALERELCGPLGPIMSEAVANRIFPVLVEECGCPEVYLMEFAAAMCQSYRYPKAFPFGGRGLAEYGARVPEADFHWDRDGFRVAYPQEYATAERDASVARANARLRAVQRELPIK